jgi:hypothetical protein
LLNLIGNGWSGVVVGRQDGPTLDGIDFAFDVLLIGGILGKEHGGARMGGQNIIVNFADSITKLLWNE